MGGERAPELLLRQLRRYLHAPASNLKIPSLPLETTQNYPDYLRLLSSCRDLSTLLQIHARLIVSPRQNHQATSTHLLKSYLSFNKCDSARLVFDSMPSPTVMLYNSMIRAYAMDKQHKEGIKMYRSMLNRGLEPDKYTFTFVLKACTGALDFNGGVLVHKDVVLRGLEGDSFIGTGLVDMYCKMGDLGSARQLFEKMCEKDVVAWNAMISGLSQSEDPSEALGIIRSMQWSGVEPNLVSILSLVPAVSRLGDLESCRCIHGYVIRRGLDLVVSNGLIDMYSKCGNINMACHVFWRVKCKDDACWGTMMAGYAHNRCWMEILELFDCMKENDVRLNKVSAVSSLIAASEMRDLDRGKQIHDCFRQQGIDSDVSIVTPTMAMYAKCGEVDKAKHLFQCIKGKDLVAWSAIVAALVQSGYPEEALTLFQGMQNEGLKANEVTLMSVIPACAEVSSLRLGKSVHCYVVKGNMDSDTSIGTALVSMYAKCGRFTYALTIFNRLPCKDTEAWNALINGYHHLGQPDSAMEMFHKLQLSEIRPDFRTMVCLLASCVLLHDLKQGSCIHGQVIKCGCESDSHVTGALIDMYAKCGSISSAESLFARIEFIKDEVCWNIMIGGYLHSGLAKEAVSAFCQMKVENLHPSVVTFVSVLPATAFLSALREGMALHACVIRMGFQSNTLVGNSLVDMYAKCGQLGYAETVFHELKNKEIVSWNVMLAGYSVHGRGNHAVELFSRMEEYGVRVDSLSFINVLSACRHAGLIEEGRKIFHSMSEKHRIEPDLEHYACMVDLLGRGGLFDEALVLIKDMPMEADKGVWGALLGACVIHSNVYLAEFALDHLVRLEPLNPTHYVSLSSTYAESGRWEDAGSTRSTMIMTGLRKSPGCSWVSAES